MSSTKASVLEALDASIADMVRPREYQVPKDWRLSGALAYLAGALRATEPEIAAKLLELLEAAK